MLVNVYTYYENKLALQDTQRRAKRTRYRKPKPSVHPAPPPVWERWSCRGCLLGIILGEILWMLHWPAQVPPLVTLALLASWGLLLGSALDWTLFRLRKVMGALRGDRLRTDDVRVLAGRARAFSR